MGYTFYKTTLKSLLKDLCKEDNLVDVDGNLLGKQITIESSYKRNIDNTGVLWAIKENRYSDGRIQRFISCNLIEQQDNIWRNKVLEYHSKLLGV